MPEFTPNTFERFSGVFSEIAGELTEDILSLHAEYAKAVAEDPNKAFRLQRRIRRKFRALITTYIAQGKDIMSQELPKAYLRGIQQINGQLAGLGIAEATGAINLRQLLLPSGAGAVPPSEAAIRLLSRYPRHLTLYSVFQAAAEGEIADMRLPILRNAEDTIRQIGIQSGQAAYQEANTFTRRQFSQDILDRAADRGITGIVYRGGRRVTVEAYAEMLARTQTANAARQASMNRQTQYGLDLVRISSHSPCSTLCYPWQGRVYSLGGGSEKYPELQEATRGGLYHANCKHSQSAYIPGISGKLENPGQFAGSSRRNRKGYQAQKRQRQIERQIRHWKRREAVAITPEAQRKAQGKIAGWQGAQREHVAKHGYLRRKYEREQV